MGKSIKFLGALMIVGLSFTFLSGCSHSPESTEVPSASVEIPDAGPKLSYYEDGLPYDENGILKYNYIEPDSARGQAFLSVFKSQFQDLTGGPERPDRYIISTGNKLCAEIEWKQRNENYTMTFDEMKRFVTPRVEGGSVDRVATPEEADGIARLSLNTLCTEYVSLLPA